MTRAQSLVRDALWAAQTEGAVLDALTQTQMICAVQMDAIERLTPEQRGATLVRALMAPYPVGFFRALRACGGLRRLLPEVDALFGVPMLSDHPEPIDTGEHQLRVLGVAARQGAPLAVRFAGLMQRIGMGATPPARWPGHPGHDVTGRALLASIAQRIALPDALLNLAALTIAEADRVHRVTARRAGAIAALLERVDAQTQPERFEQLLLACTCDYAGYPGHSEADYTKVARLRRALAAYLAVPMAGTREALRDARAHAIARDAAQDAARDSDAR